MNESNTEEINETKVLIIGAGAAGLSAANHLLKNGINDFYILEARNRIGGRIVAINIENKKLQLGASWIHGILGNPIYELASANGLIDIIQERKPHNLFAALPDGKRISFSILNDTFEAYSLFFKRCEEYFFCKYQPPDNVLSVGEHITLEKSIYLEQFSEKDRTIRESIFRYLLNKETCISGCNSMNDIDLLELGGYTELPGGNIEVTGGYSSILGLLMKDIPSDKILKGHSVSEIKWKKNNAKSKQPIPNCYTKTFPNVDNYENKPVPLSKVKCENGSVFLAKHIICTIPLGVLKEKANTIFEPLLPEYKSASISKLLFGTVNKIYLEFERPFLPMDLTEIIFLWDEININKPIAHRWFMKIYSFNKISDTLLLGWISGEEAKFMESLSFETVSEKCTEILRQFLSDHCIPKPKRCICTNWWSQPLTRGSYTSIPVGASQQDIVNLSLPLYADPMCEKPSLLFAGEHCHVKFYSTVHGAFLSGKEAAQILIADSTAASQSETDESDEKLTSWMQGIDIS